MDRLNFLRGIGMASMYSWSCKRMYKNGFVWHDLSENDLIYPAHGQEYVLKGSELVDNTLFETDSSLVSKKNLPPPPLPPPPPPPLESAKDGDGEVDIPAMHRQRRNQSCSSIGLNLQEYCVYRAESSGSASADASTQTDDKRRRNHSRRPLGEAEAKQYHEIVEEKSEIEISPPSSNSSTETLGTLMKADGRLILQPETVNDSQTDNSQRSKTSSILMQLISCGSVSFNDCGPGQGLNLIALYKQRLPRSKGSGKLTAGTGREKLEGKEYFSGSLVETKKEEFLTLKRSSSYNADR
ncbi:Hypothetical predicted protein [Olea europaea subsp. europaea]|nr:Hypothetical predicted protein [Olea europaea subsp. europaea]